MVYKKYNKKKALKQDRKKQRSDSLLATGSAEQERLVFCSSI